LLTWSKNAPLLWNTNVHHHAQTTHHWTLFSPHPRVLFLNIYFNIILSMHSLLRSLSGFQTKILCAIFSYLSHICYMSCHPNSAWQRVQLCTPQCAVLSSTLRRKLSNHKDQQLVPRISSKFQKSGIRVYSEVISCILALISISQLVKLRKK
jgi:hypothetical protein